jgi:hypothetical protein
MQAFGKNLFFTALVLLIFFAAAEIVLRTTHLFGARLSYSHPDPVLGYRLTPHRKYWHFRENTHPITGKINSFGWRDHDRTLEKPESAYRVAILGDSQVESINVELDSTFCSIAERQLTERYDHRFELLNFGRSSFTQTEELLILRDEVLRFSPDAVFVLLLPHNDISDVRRETTGSTLRPFFLFSEGGEPTLDTSFHRSRSYRIRSILNPWKQRSALISLVVERYHLSRRMRTVRPPVALAGDDRKIHGPLSVCTASADTALVSSYRLNKILLAEMADLCRREGIAFGLISSSWIYRTEACNEYRSIDPSFDPDFLEEDLGAFADSIGIDFLGLQKPFRRSYEKTGEALDWGHWNYHGHRFVAELLTAKLEEMISRQGRQMP